LMKGNEAVAEAAVMAGCRFFAGYPITPQNEIPEYMSRRMFEVGGTFIQAESEVSAINMLYGASGAGARCMTSSSSPGISLKQEGISYMAASELPAVIVNMQRCGPGLGGIQPSQSDYFQATKGGGHGDYRLPVFGPSTVQELIDVCVDAFDMADRYRTPVLILGDSVLGQMMEPVTFDPSRVKPPPPKPWATTGARGRTKNIINSLYLQPEVCETLNLKLQAKYRQIVATEVRYEEVGVEDATVIGVAYGTSARLVRAAVDRLREEGLKVGMIRPITLWPFPDAPFERAVARGKVRSFFVVEMSSGQMLEDVRLVVAGRRPIRFHGRMGGIMPTPEAVLDGMRRLAAGEAVPSGEKGFNLDLAALGGDPK
jgi:2-oxoglutarate ferredoxin oxidoreductase subunit alpha